MIYFFTPAFLILAYRVQMALFAFFTLIVTVQLIRQERNDVDYVLVTQLSPTWTVLQIFASFVYWRIGASHLTVWSPSFIAALVFADFYLMYRNIVSTAIELESTKKINRIVSQVTHDIRAPVSATKVLLQTPGDFSDEDKDLLQTCTRTN